MPPIALDTIYTKTAKGILEVKNKAVKMPRELGLIFLSVDGKASVGDLQPRSGMTHPQLQHALSALETDGYIKVVTPGGQQAAANDDNVDFTQRKVMASVNAEAASHALAAAEAVKRVQAEAKAALEARLRQEAEARARTLAETRAEAEGDAKTKARDSARAAAEARVRAEREAESAADPAARAEAEARTRAAAADVVRAEAEVRVRSEAEARALAQAEEKRAAEEDAAKEAEAHGQAEQQAQARAAAEVRAKDVLEAQLKAMEALRAISDPNSPEAAAARARLREIEYDVEHARDAALEIAAAEGRANEIPQPEMDIAERVRQLNARVAAERKSREAVQHDPHAVEFQSAESGPEAAPAFSALKLNTVATAGTPKPIDDLPMVEIPAAGAPKPIDDLPMVEIPTDDEPVRTPEREAALAEPSGEPSALPVVDLNRTETALHLPPEHVPTALERVMTELAARQQAKQEQEREPEPEKPPPDPAARTQPLVLPPIAEMKDGSTEKVEPTLDIEEPIAERLNIDRASHDLIAEQIDARRKAEAMLLAQDAVEARRRRAEEEARRASVAGQQVRRRKILWSAVVAAIVLPTLGVLWMQFQTLNGYIPAAQRAISQRLNQPTTIQNLRYVLLPTPRLTLDDVWIGKGQGVKVKRLEARVHPLAALAGPGSFDLVEVHGVEIDPAIFATIPKWTGGQPADTVRVGSLRITDLKLNMPGESLGSFSGTVVFASNGTVKDAAFQNDKVKLTLTPGAEGVRVALDATSWRVPYGPALTFDRLKLSGLIDEKQVAAGEFTGTLAAGAVEGAITARWAGPVAVQGEFKLQSVRLLELTQELTPNFAGRGTLKASGRFSMQGTDWTTVRANPQVESTFSVSRGELTNIDLVRAIQSAAPGAMRGGRTAFEDLSGIMQMSGERVAFRQLQLTSGALNANGTVDVSPQGQLSGRFSAQLAGGGGGVVARSSLGVTGTVANPSLTR